MDIESLKSAGWTTRETGGFSAVIGPLWIRGTGADCELGFVAESRHGNNHIGTVHGGVLMTLADIGLGFGVVQALGVPHCATVQLQTHFISAAWIGDFIVCRPELVRRGTLLVFMRGLISSGDKVVASADGIWKVLEQKPR